MRALPETISKENRQESKAAATTKCPVQLLLSNARRASRSATVMQRSPRLRAGHVHMLQPRACCGPALSADELALQIGYSADQIRNLPEGANMGLSCGNPTAIAALKPGQVVLDLGSGGGFDVFWRGRRWVLPAALLVWT